MSLKGRWSGSTTFRRSVASYKQRNPVYVTQAPKHLIAALRSTLQELEMTVPSDADQLIFAELKRILNQRIIELESCAATLPVALPHAKSTQVMDS